MVRLLPLFFLSVLCTQQVLSQNLDLLSHAAAGVYGQMAGAGMGLAEGLAALDLNPSGLAATPAFSVSVAYHTTRHGYSLFNNRHDPEVGRRFSQPASGTFDWGRTDYNLQHALAAIPVTMSLAVGGGVIQKINPFLYNRRRAFTWSILLNQRTEGSVYALALGGGWHIHKQVMVGGTFYRYSGTITSSVRGDNHGNDVQKWARLEQVLRGMNARLGARINRKRFSVGIVGELPFNMTVQAKKEISDDRTYAALFPAYDETTWKMPWSLGVGLAFRNNPTWTVSIDGEMRRYLPSAVQFNLYEYGSEPNWKSVYTARVGVAYTPSKRLPVPLRVGYAYLPQVYASNLSTGGNHSIFGYEDTEQNVRHRFTAGTTFTFAHLAVNMGIAYGILHWHRDLQTEDFGFIEDLFKERTYSLTTELVYTLK